ncbi:organic solute transporter subunit alpha-like isoform X2 [Lineus longissimus]|uniref:organic solute transporter subunit alpha-like isoform X2 n=1 Tax=Lineus longissimus TaxID=88925 RepID=UPI00315CE8D6
MTDNCTDGIPSTAELFQDVDGGQLAVVVICWILTLACVGIYIEEIIYILRVDVADRKERSRPIWILGIYPAVSLTSVISVCVPRATLVNELVSAMYLSICILQFLKLIVSYFGGRQHMIAVLTDQKMNLRSPPCCCCCFCLPEITVTKYTLVKMHYMVLQVVVIRPLIFFGQAIYLADLGDSSAAPSALNTVASTLHLASTLTAMYGLVLVHRVAEPHLEKFQTQRKFRTLQLVLLFCNLQSGIFNLLANNGVFPCTPGGFTSKTRASNMHHTLLVFEMFLLSLVARYFYRRKEPLANFSAQVGERLADNDVLQKETDRANYGSIHMTDAVFEGLEDSGNNELFL